MLSIIFKKPWGSGDIPEDCKKANVTPSIRRFKNPVLKIQVIIGTSVLF